MGLDQLSICLWEEQAALEELAFRLEQQLLVLMSGRHQWLTRTTTEVTGALDRLGEIEKQRAELARSASEDLGVTGEITLKALADASDPQRGKALVEHRQKLRNALGVVHDLAGKTRGILARNVAATTDALAFMGAGSLGAYDAGGSPSRFTESALLLDAKA